MQRSVALFVLNANTRGIALQNVGKGLHPVAEQKFNTLRLSGFATVQTVVHAAVGSVPILSTTAELLPTCVPWGMKLSSHIPATSSCTVSCCVAIKLVHHEEILAQHWRAVLSTRLGLGCVGEDIQ